MAKGAGGGGGVGGRSGGGAQAAFDAAGAKADAVAVSGGHVDAIDDFLNVERARASRDEREGRANDASAKMNTFLREAQSKGATYKGPVYRGTSQAELQQILKTGRNGTTWSVSKDHAGSMAFAKKGGVLIKFKGKSGAVPMDGIRGSNTFHEALIPRGSKWNVVSQRSRKGVTVVTLEASR